MVNAAKKIKRPELHLLFIQPHTQKKKKEQKVMKALGTEKYQQKSFIFLRTQNLTLLIFCRNWGYEVDMPGRNITAGVLVVCNVPQRIYQGQF